MCPRVAIATEGPASEAVLLEIGRGAGWTVGTRSTEGKDKLFREFPRMLTSLGRGYDFYIVAPDLQPAVNCPEEAERWRVAIDSSFPNARLCLAIWETEAWLLADPNAMERALGFSVSIPHSDYVGGDKPSSIIESEFRRWRGYRRGLGFDKKTDGAAIARAMDLAAARRRSASLDHFLRAGSREHRT